ncbi:MAG: FtsX-like permease family protein, partial [Massilia sp.]
MEIKPILSALMRNKTGAVLVALQVALSLAILSNALHIVNLRQAVSARPSGMADEASLFYINVRHLDQLSHIEQMALQKAETATLRAVPGVTSVAFTSQMPMSRSGSSNSVSLDRRQQESSAHASIYISPDSLVKTWGMELLEGRDLAPADVVELDNSVEETEASKPKSVLITRALAQKLWPADASYTGKTLYLGVGADSDPVQVAGVLKTLQTQQAQLSENGAYSLVLPIRLTNGYSTIFTMRAEPGQRDRVMKEAETALRAAARRPVILRVKTVDEDRINRYRADRSLAWMLITVSVLLLLITASGIVGMASLWVTQRRKQIGVRRALGARRLDILRYFLTENFMITSLGIGAGVLLALGLNALLVRHLEMARLP